jgi:hypothetical protein
MIDCILIRARRCSKRPIKEVEDLYWIVCTTWDQNFCIHETPDHVTDSILEAGLSQEDSVFFSKSLCGLALSMDR